MVVPGMVLPLSDMGVNTVLSAYAVEELLSCKFVGRNEIAPQPIPHHLYQV